MNKRTSYAVVAVATILLGVLLATTPREQLLLYEEFTSLEFYPEYYSANFTVTSSLPNIELSFDIEIDRAGNYTDCGTLWALLHVEQEQFEETFNVTEVHDAMSTEDWDVEDFGAIWAGWFIGNSFFPHWESIPSGPYVLVFWIDPDGPTTDWSATLSVSLRTRLLSMM
ncbi:MAG: hypothetical protein PVJ05_11005 [Candidatus Thorarchaeota archaeon]|jgi:hypothetical protein